jgi:hypothetical protein
LIQRSETGDGYTRLCTHHVRQRSCRMKAFGLDLDLGEDLPPQARP